MTKPTDLMALAERVERSDGPDRELEARIWCIVGVGSPWTEENCWLAATVRPPELESIGLTLEQSTPKAKAKMAEIQNMFADAESEFWAAHTEQS